MLVAEKLRYHEVEDFEDLHTLFDPDTFLKEMLKLGVIHNITGNYSDDCYNLCNNATAYIGVKLCNEDSYMSFDLEVVEGLFNYNPHTWLKLGDYYIDLTLQQFLPNAPIIAITEIEQASYPNLYYVHNEYPFRQWSKMQ